MSTRLEQIKKSIDEFYKGKDLTLEGLRFKRKWYREIKIDPLSDQDASLAGLHLMQKFPLLETADEAIHLATFLQFQGNPYDKLEECRDRPVQLQQRPPWYWLLLGSVALLAVGGAIGVGVADALRRHPCKQTKERPKHHR